MLGVVVGIVVRQVRFKSHALVQEGEAPPVRGFGAERDAAATQLSEHVTADGVQFALGDMPRRRRRYLDVGTIVIAKHKPGREFAVMAETDGRKGWKDDRLDLTRNPLGNNVVLPEEDHIGPPGW